MKTLEAIIEQRDKLKRRRVECEDARNTVGTSWFYLESENEKRKFVRLSNIMAKLDIQIDALTYVINYDNEIMDVADTDISNIKHT